MLREKGNKMNTNSSLIKRISEIVPCGILAGLLTFVLITEALPKTAEFNLPKERRAIVQQSIYPDNKLMMVFDRFNNEKERFGSIDNYVAYENRETGERYVIGKKGYFLQANPDSLVPFGQDSLSGYLQSRKVEYDSLMDLTRNEGE